MVRVCFAPEIPVSFFISYGIHTGRNVIIPFTRDVPTRRGRKLLYIFFILSFVRIASHQQ